MTFFGKKLCSIVIIECVFMSITHLVNTVFIFEYYFHFTKLTLLTKPTLREKHSRIARYFLLFSTVQISQRKKNSEKKLKKKKISRLLVLLDSTPVSQILLIVQILNTDLCRSILISKKSHFFTRFCTYSYQKPNM